MNHITLQIDCLIFSTSVQDRHSEYRLSKLMDGWTGIKNWSIDLEDWQKVLRVECVDIEPDQIRKKLRKLNIQSQQMPVW